MFHRLKRLWELSNSTSVAADEILATEIKKERKLHKTKQQAVVVQDDPLDIFNSEEDLSEIDNDKTS